MRLLQYGLITQKALYGGIEEGDRKFLSAPSSLEGVEAVDDGTDLPH
jgi:hypothetical protein